MKKFWALILSISVLMQCGGVINVFAAEQENVAFEENFEEKTAAAVGAQASGIGVAEIVADGTYGDSLHLNTDMEGTAGAGAGYSITFPTQSMSGKLSFSLNYKASTGWTSLYFGNTICLYLNAGTLGSHLGTSTPGHMGLSANEWYDIDVEFDIPAGKYDVYVNYEKIASDVSVRNAEAFRTFAVTVPRDTDILLDNIRIVTENTTSAKPADPEQAATPAPTATPEAETKKMISAGEGETIAVATADSYIGMRGAYTDAYGRKEGSYVINGYRSDITVTRDNGAGETMAFFKFTAPEVAEGKRAYLNLWLDSAAYASDNEVFTVYATETNWTEDLASSDAPIKLTDTVGKKVFQKDEAKQWIKIDITDYVKKNSGKEISLSLRGDSVSGTSTLKFDSRENICKPNIIVCNPVMDVPAEIKGFSPVAAEVSFKNIANTAVAIAEKAELNVYVLGNTYADMAKNPDIYGNFIRSLSGQFGVKMNYINKAMSGLQAQDAVDMASKLMEDQTPDLIIVDFEGLGAAEASAIVAKYRGINGKCEFIFVTDGEDITGDGVLALTRERLIGAMPVDIAGNEEKAYVAPPSEKYRIKEKDEQSIVDYYSMDDGFESRFVFENQKQYFTLEDDELIGGKYLRIKKNTARGYAGGEYFMTPLGGEARIDFQLCAFSPDTVLELFFYPAGRQSVMTQIILENGVLSAGTNREKIADIKCNQWYNVAVLYNLNEYKYDVLLDGEPILRDVAAAMDSGTLISVQIQINDGNMGDVAIDSLRTSYYTEEERALEPAEEEAVISDEPRIVFSNDFESESAGVLANDSAGTISYVKEGGNTFAHIDRTSNTGSASTIYSFEETKSNISLELDFRLNDLSNATKLLYINTDVGFAIPIYFNVGTMKVNDPAYTAPEMSPLSVDEWHHLKIVTDLANQTYFVYIDDELIGMENGYNFSIAGATKFTGFRFSISAGIGTYDIDNVIVQTLEGAVESSEAVKRTLAGYDPINVDAPENNAWTEEFRRNPSGEIYEAEDMQLYNYEAYTDYNFHNNRGIKVAETGAGTASFTYNGETGYKRIDIGYLEEDGKHDSHFYLYQNDELIDWFVCQNDQVGRYNRIAKEYWYVKKGDVFTVRGTHGEEPSMLDYVEFTDGAKAEFKFGTLAAAINASPLHLINTSWDADEAGGWASSGLTIRDSRTDESVTLERRLADFYSDFTVEYVYTPYADSKYNAVVGYSDGENVTYPIDIRFDGSSIIAGGKEYKNALKKGGASNLRISVDTDSKTYAVIVDSVVIAKDVPFICDVPKFNIFRFISDKEGTAYFCAHPFLLEAGYALNEDFFCESANNVELYNWEVSGRTAVVKDNTDVYDMYHRALTPGTEIKTALKPQSDVITYETWILFTEKKDGVRAAIGDSDDGEIALYTSGGNICYDDGKGGTGIVWENYKPYVWYEYKLEIDMASHKCKFYVNSFQSVEVPITENLLQADYVKFTAGNDAGDVWVDDIAVFKGTYLDDNDVPEIEVPEGYGEYNVILQTCDMWREGEHFGYDLLRPWAARTPFLGYYEDGNPEVADWQTKYMVEHGINVFAPCWYAVDAQSPPKNLRNGYALDQGFMNSKYQDQIQFSICLCYAGVTAGEENFLNYFVNYWIEHYFKHPSYFKVDNKPVIMCFNVAEFTTAFGDRCAAVLEKVEEMLRAEGFDGAIFIGEAGSASKANGWDYGYTYTFGAIDGYKNILEINARAGKDTPYIPTVTQGWGNEAWGIPARKTNMPVKDWKASMEWVKNVYMPAFADDPLLKNTISLDNWNEYCEGHSISPTNLAGFGYLDAVRDVFTRADKEHTDIIPTERFDQMSPMLW